MLHNLPIYKVLLTFLVLLATINIHLNAHELSQPEPEPIGVPMPVTDYNQDCKDAGVPIPPTFPKGWTKQDPPGTIKDGDLISHPGGQVSAELWKWVSTTDPKGFCVAFVRKMADNTFIVGVICSSDEGKTCFWDKVGEDGTWDVDHLGDPSTRPAIDPCTKCHFGNNPIIVTETLNPGLDDIIDIIDSYPDWEYKPVKPWDHKNDPTTVPVEHPALCTDCHDSTNGTQPNLPPIGPYFCHLTLGIMDENGDGSGGTMPFSQELFDDCCAYLKANNPPNPKNIKVWEQFCKQ